jgi:hypothetical protein
MVPVTSHVKVVLFIFFYFLFFSAKLQNKAGKAFKNQDKIANFACPDKLLVKASHVFSLFSSPNKLIKVNVQESISGSTSYNCN